ncbi:hypothetical protein [Endozoicomonas sp. 2B-B]
MAWTPERHDMCRPMLEEEARAWWWHVGAGKMIESLPEVERPAAQLTWLLIRWRVDPVCFAVEALRIVLHKYQIAILLDLADAPVELYKFYGVNPNQPKRQVLIPAGHGVGKTRVLAVAIWWHKLTTMYSYNLCTAPTAPQLTGRLWDELRKMYRRLKERWPDLANRWEIQRDRITHIDSENADWTTVARTARADKPEGLQGAHALDADDEFGQLADLFGEDRKTTSTGGIMVVIDEASGVDDSIRKVLRGALSESGARLIAPGNPTRPDGWFADDTDKKDRYSVHHLDCRESDLTRVYEIPYRDTSGNIQQLKLRGFVDPSYWNDLYEDCDKDEDHDEFRIRVRGVKPRSAYSQVNKTYHIEAAIERADDPDSKHEQAIIGLDFGLTSDKHALAVRQGFNMLEGEEWLPKDNPDEITLDAADRAIAAQKTFGARIIIGDSNGVGRGAMEYLSRYYREHPELKVRVIHFNSGLGAVDKTRYHRRRDEMWHKKGRPHFANPRCSLLDIPGLKSQLTAPGYREGADRKIRVETKDEMKKRGVESGNIADAYQHTLMVTPREKEERKEEEPKHPPAFQAHFKKLAQQRQQRRYIR